MASDQIPIAACSLEPGAQASRAADFRALLAPNLRVLSRAGAAAQLDLALDRSDERALASLVELEAALDAFLSSASRASAAAPACPSSARPGRNRRALLIHSRPSSPARPRTRAESQ